MKPLTLFFCLISFNAFNQTLYGDWAASCKDQRIDSSTMTFCDVCDYYLHDNVMDMYAFEMKFSPGNLWIIHKEKTYNLDFKFDDATSTLAFKFKKNDENFTVKFDGDDHIILVDDDNDVVDLKRKLD